MPGYPDWQKIQQWLGAPIAQATGAAVGAGTITLGPFNLASWASLVVSLKPTGGNVTLTVKQKISGGPTTLELDTQFVVAAGTTVFEAVVLFGDAVTVTLQGTTVGETVDYAVYPSNTTTNAQVLASATVNFQKAGVLVAAEPTLNFFDGLGIKVSLVDDPTNTRMGVTIDQAAIADSVLLAPAASVDVQNIPATYACLRNTIYGRGDTAATEVSIRLRFNNDSAADYDYEALEATGATPLAFQSVGDTSIFCAELAAATATADIFDGAEVIVPNYAGAVGQKVTLGALTTKRNNVGGYFYFPIGGWWRSKAPIDRETFSPQAGNLITGSRITVRGEAGV